MKKTATFTQIIIRIGYFVLAALCFYLPFSITMFNFESIEYFNPLLLEIPFYLVVPAGYVALVSTDLIMAQIKKGDVFNGKIVKYISSLVLACVYAGAVGIVSFVIEHFFCNFTDVYIIVLASAELFMALICNVLKHCFKAGNEIKDENDLTI